MQKLNATVNVTARPANRAPRHDNDEILGEVL
ncbi:hypothetical protein SAMN05443999_10688 [Roseovarius azorensis]|uniref:Uncharacterized protein n=1 Tax=Roseovarius azorensis TaxID=1287727 RepID=A0A1H7R7E3_9RHOB|nr:hypothetical protein SAMN05443999_10688 [Roseovarius azorensis]